MLNTSNIILELDNESQELAAKDSLTYYWIKKTLKLLIYFLGAKQ